MLDMDLYKEYYEILSKYVGMHDRDELIEELLSLHNKIKCCSCKCVVDAEDEIYCNSCKMDEAN